MILGLQVSLHGADHKNKQFRIFINKEGASKREVREQGGWLAASKQASEQVGRQTELRGRKHTSSEGASSKSVLN